MMGWRWPSVRVMWVLCLCAKMWRWWGGAAGRQPLMVLKSETWGRDPRSSGSRFEVELEAIAGFGGALWKALKMEE